MAKKNYNFSIRTNELTAHKLEEYAKKNRITRNEYINRLFEEHIEANENFLK